MNGMESSAALIMLHMIGLRGNIIGGMSPVWSDGGCFLEVRQAAFAAHVRNGGCRVESVR